MLAQMRSVSKCTMHFEPTTRICNVGLIQGLMMHEPAALRVRPDHWGVHVSVLPVVVITVAIVTMIAIGDILDAVDGKGRLFCSLFPHMITVLLPHRKSSKSDSRKYYLILCVRALDIRSICWFLNGVMEGTQCRWKRR